MKNNENKKANKANKNKVGAVNNVSTLPISNELEYSVTLTVGKKAVRLAVILTAININVRSYLKVGYEFIISYLKLFKRNL